MTRVAWNHQYRRLLHDDGALLISVGALESACPAIGACPGRARFEDFAFDGENIACADGMRPADLLHADTDQTADDSEVAFDHQPHRQGGGVPAAGHQAAEKA